MSDNLAVFNKCNFLGKLSSLGAKSSAAGIYKDTTSIITAIVLRFNILKYLCGATHTKGGQELCRKS